MELGAILEFWREIYKAALPVEKPLVSTIGKLFKHGETATPKEITAEEMKALAEFTGAKINLPSDGKHIKSWGITRKSAATLGKKFIKRICPPNCYDATGFIATAYGKRHYTEIRRLTQTPVEIKTAPIGDCTKCIYAKARGTQHDTCAKCQELNTYFEWCRTFEYDTRTNWFNCNNGLSGYRDVLKIGFDNVTSEIIIPLTGRQYVSIEIKDWFSVKDYAKANAILSHFNRLPRNMELSADNCSMPYLDNRFVGTDGEIIFAGCIGQVYHKINLPFPPAEPIKILQPYKLSFKPP